MWYLLYAYMFLLALALSLALTPLAQRLAARTGLVDEPDARKSHGRAVPLLGGASVFGAIALTLLANAGGALAAARNPSIAALLPPSLRTYLGGALSTLPTLLAVLAGGLAIFLLGLWDDARDMRPKVKLCGQILVGLLVASLGIRVTAFVPVPLFSTLATVLWVVAIMNSFNLLDNMDGLCAGVALVSSSIFWGISAREEHYFIAVLLAVLGGSLLGYLRYNVHPARIFLGDAGSMTIGYFIAVASILQTYYHPVEGGRLAVFMPLVILAVPLYDTLSVIVIRVSRGESIFRADRRHFSHRLLNLGMSVRGAVCFIWLVTLCTGLAAVFLPWVGWKGGLVVFAQTILIVSVIAILEYFGGTKRNSDAPARS